MRIAGLPGFLHGSATTIARAKAPARSYNRSLLTPAQRDRIEVVLVSPRNPLNIGAVARAMANFGFANLTVVSPYQPHWREAKSAVGSGELLLHAKESPTLAEAVRGCSLVLGTGSLTHRKPEQPVVALNRLGIHLAPAFGQGCRIAVVFGPEKHGLTREDLSRCHLLVEIPTDPIQPSMNLGQAAAVVLYQLATHDPGKSAVSRPAEGAEESPRQGQAIPATSGDLDILAGLIEEVMMASRYSPKAMQVANQHDLRVMLRRLRLGTADTRRALGLFRRILWRFRSPNRNVT
jgi:TrmH family RNA methyltransferase